MRAAITGANGFIGSHLCGHLANTGWDVRPVLRSDLSSGVSDSLFRGVDVVIHAAGATRAPTVRLLRAANVDLTRVVADAAARAGVRRFIFLSSQAAAGPATGLDRPVTEETPPCPVEGYGRSKLDAEEVVRAVREMEHVIIRPAAVYGPGDRDFLAMFRLARHGVALHPGNREQWISIVHVADLARDVAAAAVSPVAAGRVYFVANREPARWADLFALAAAAGGRTLRLDLEIPYAVARMAARVGDVVGRATGRAGLLSSGKLALARPEFWICSGERAAAELGRRQAIDLADGFRTTYEWYESHGWLRRGHVRSLSRS